MPPPRRATPLGELLLLLLCVAATSAISVEGAKGQHQHGDIDPDEYLWSKLPGRCCFQLQEDCAPGQRKSECKRRPPDTCRECAVWSTPENYCHGSHENCDSCGMKLYCPSPPPLLDGNKVCTGGSRVGFGCNDEMGTGMCAQSTEGDCEEACRANADCELFVFYPEEKKGTCVLCADLISYERTIDEASRAYAVGASRAPPAPPGAATPKQFSVMPNPSPPSPPRPPAPHAPAPHASHLGRHKSDKSRAHVDCTFLDGVEFTTERQTGYTDRVAASKEECCTMCGHSETGCANFVYEPSSGQCVLLPLTPLSELEKDDNPEVISGTASVGLVAVGAAEFRSDSCSFLPDSGYSSGSLGVAPRLPGGEMQTREECCQVCGVTKGCARFTFSPGSKACIMYAAYAEMVMVNDLTSGSIPSKLSGATIPGAGQSAHSAAEEAAAALALEPPAPALPIFAKLEYLPPPPPPDLSIHGDSTALQDLISDLSVVVFTVIALGFLMCVYCFFAPQLLSSLHHATNGKMGKVHVRAHRHLRVPDDDDEAWMRMRVNESTAVVPVDDPPPRRKKRNGRKERELKSSRGGGRGGVVSMRRKSSTARLVMQTPTITKSKDADVSHCSDLEALRDVFYDEFASALKAVRPEHTQLFCLAPPPTAEQAEEDPLAWLLVTSASDFARVIKCPALRLQDIRCDEAQSAEYIVAFATYPQQQAQPPDPEQGIAKVASGSYCAPQGAADRAAEVPRGRSKDRRGGRGFSSAPPSCVGGLNAAEDGEGSDDSATSSRQSLLRGTGTTRAPCATSAEVQAALHEQALAAGLALTSTSLEQLHASSGQPGGAVPASRAPSVVFHEDPDGTGVSRSDRARAMAELE